MDSTTPDGSSRTVAHHYDSFASNSLLENNTSFDVKAASLSEATGHMTSSLGLTNNATGSTNSTALNYSTEPTSFSSFWTSSSTIQGLLGNTRIAEQGANYDVTTIERSSLLPLTSSSEFNFYLFSTESTATLQDMAETSYHGLF